MIDNDLNPRGDLENDKNDVLMNYLDKLYLNYRDTTRIIGRLLYVLLLLFFFTVYISIVGEPINVFGIKQVPSKHITLLAPLILGFIYMAIGGFSIYKKRLKEFINQTYQKLELRSETLEDESETNFLMYPTYAEIIRLLSKTSKEEEESETVQYFYSFINLLRIFFVFIIPLWLLVYLITPRVYEKADQFYTVLFFVCLYLVLPSVGVVSVTWKLHGIYYRRIKRVFKNLFSNKLVITLITWLVGILIIDLVIAGILFIFFIPSLFLWKDKIPCFQWSDLCLIINNAWWSIFLLSYFIVFTGFLFGIILEYSSKLINDWDKKY